MQEIKWHQTHLGQEYGPKRDAGRRNMKRVIAVVVAALFGMGAGVVVWTGLAVAALIVYWVGFVFLYCGVVCGRPGGKGFGLGWCDPPENLGAINDTVVVGTAIAFTWGEILVALLGAAIGMAAALGLIRLFSALTRIIGRNKVPPAAQSRDAAGPDAATDQPHD